jgi:hypothetical protein
MVHTHTVIKKNFSVINHLTWIAATEFADDGDMILTIKDNHVSAIRKVIIIDMHDEPHIEWEHVAGSIIPFYD